MGSIISLLVSGIIFLAVLTLVATVFVALGKGIFRKYESWPFYAVKPLSDPEQVLYFRLIKALPDCVVLAQVQISRMIRVKKGHPAQSWRNRVDRLSADFVICKKDLTVIAVIELDDASHLKPSRKATDAKKDQALASAGIPVVRWQSSMMPDASAIKSAIEPKLM